MLRSPPFFLLWPHLRSAANARRSRDGRSRLRLLLFAALGCAFIALAFLGARWMFFKFSAVEYLAELLIRRVLGLVLLFFSGLLVFSSLITAFSTFYLADDLPLLITSPVPVRRLYLARLAETWAQASWMMLVFALPVAAGCGPVLGAPFWFYPLLLGLMVPLTLLCSAVGTVGAMLLAWLLPARRTQDVLMVLALIAFLVLYVAFRLAEPEKLLDPAGFDRLVALIGSLRQDGGATTPADWYVAAVFGALRLETGPRDADAVRGAVLPALALVTGALASLFVGAWVAEGVYFRSWSLSQEGRTGQEQSRLTRLVGFIAPAVAVRRRPRPFAAPGPAFRWRDTRVFLRTTSQWTQLLLIAALVVVYVFNFKHFRTLVEAGQIGPTFLSFLNYILSVFVVTTLAARFLYPAVSLEGRAFWVVQAAPVRARELVAAKVRWGLGPLLTVSTALSVGSGWLSGAGVGGTLTVGAIAGLSTVSLAGLAVGMGAAEPRFHEDNPARIASSVGGVLFMLLGLAYMVAMVVLLVGPLGTLAFHLQSGFVPGPGRLATDAARLLGALALSAFTFIYPLRRGAARLETLP